jgi:endonuclease YncB( thermonuclease family)
MYNHFFNPLSNIKDTGIFKVLACVFPILGLSCQGMELIEDDIEMVVETWCAPNQQVEVIRVYDGDTFMYLDENGVEQSIRMLGVAAPEVASEEEQAECFGDASASFLRDLIVNQEVELQFDRECTDMFQRTLSWVVLRGDDPQVAGWLQEVEMIGLESDGSYEFLVNELLVQLGYAEVFRGEVDASERYSEQMEVAEDNAELRQLGLWSACP